MKHKELTICLERNVRHERYLLSKAEVRLTVTLEEGDSLEDVYTDVHEDCEIIVEEILEKEVQEYEHRKNIIKPGPRRNEAGF